jgi:hypothetical protein
MPLIAVFREGRLGIACYQELILGGLLLRTVDHEDRYGPLLRFQLQSELFVDRFEKRNRSVGVRRRCRCVAGRWWTAFSAASASAPFPTGPCQPGRTETQSKVVTTFEPGSIEDRRMNTSRRNILELFRELRHGHVLAGHQPS